MKILYVASEVVPFIKTGGLADVASSLPIALKKLGHDVRVVLPLHRKIIAEYKDQMKFERYFYIDLNWRHQYVGVYSLELHNVTYYFLDNEYYFNRNFIYGEFDDGERYAFFSKAVALLPKEIDFKPDVIHTNDWHSAPVNLFLHEFSKGDSYYHSIKKVFTIHNLKYQGVFPPSVLGEVMGVSYEYFHDDSIKFFDNINFMKAGIIYSDIVNTVSKSYAEEIKYEYFGEGLEGILSANAYKLYGIINGIDYDLYDPSTDKRIFYNYDVGSLDLKVKNKLALQEKFNLPQDESIPIIGIITRFSDMKGIDLIGTILDSLLGANVQLIVLGTGEKEYEDMFNYFANKYPNKVSSNIYFSEEDAHKIYAGSDMFLMPSKSEPCGLSQLISLRYGTIPIVREVGGLKDTVIPFNKYTMEGNGFSFRNYNAHELLFLIFDVIRIYYDDKEAWNQIIVQAMESDYSWDKSVQEYLSLYKK